jgi:hypothetical protein
MDPHSPLSNHNESTRPRPEQWRQDAPGLLDRHVDTESGWGMTVLRIIAGLAKWLEYETRPTS